MKHLIIVVSLIPLLLVQSVSGIGIPELGVSAGTSQYFGDLNRSNPIADPRLNLGILFKYNLNERYVFRSGLYYTSLKGDGELLYNSPSLYEFNTTLIQYNVNFEVNFLEYDFAMKDDNFTPFFALGAGYAQVIQSSQEASSHVTIPFGPGVKFLFNNKLTLGVEYTVVKTFSDKVDGLLIQNFGDVTEELGISGNQDFTSQLHNKDWYGYFSVFLTFKILNYNPECATYK